jgi:RNA polymerase sigma factor (sigma-70 family)
MSELTNVEELVSAAASGDAEAWDLLVKRFLPLLFSVIGSFRLSKSDAQDVNQTVWLKLVEHLGELRDARALPGWIAVTTRNEALRVLKSRGRTVQIDPLSNHVFDAHPASASVDEDLLRSERRQVLRDALAELPSNQRNLLLLLVADPPVSYREISKQLGIPMGSIGPFRSRYLEQLRTTTALTAFLKSDSDREQFGGR